MVKRQQLLIASHHNEDAVENLINNKLRNMGPGWEFVSVKTEVMVMDGQRIPAILYTTTAVVEREEVKKTLDPNTPIQSLDIPKRAKACLQGAGIQTLAQLLQKDSTELRTIKNFGRCSLGLTLRFLEEQGLHLKGEG
ncbi:MAG: hypothetical protein A3D44_04085 [Candidatus Staskawiczbacteria bacterium RIFCSPHIGHO2_02_FULL_42_22]|uniref:RNA polymerase alpha subunit C-terminal domain-containing protein n=1 Tax=Candidatus Staskawiczbacteria bacterium RIFCSPHIGHO2_02_FULL_42_22 TaxID=1802207 RepID=A0A1G2I1M8_9BACT|nr:MAG: hypothetical protein A3D44_04085 [Candidatus Staskawiczbacteria bacterium RIFCSPHIGHO2_02_FULL_42_22]